MNRIIVSCLGLLLLCISVAPAFAGPAIQIPMKLNQPDGTVLEIQIRGDEYQNWIELLPTGQTIIRNPQTEFFEYAVPLPDGTLAPSGIKAEPGGENAPAFSPKGLKPPRNQELEERIPGQIDKTAIVSDWKALAASGTRNVLIILVNFSDRSLRTTPGGWYGKIFDTTPGVKSMANFYNDNSFGAVTVSPIPHNQPGNPAGIITATVSDAHPNYGGTISYDSDVSVANQALAQAASYLDFASYDTDGDGVLYPSELAIYFIYAGYEASGAYQTPSVWAHAWRGGTIYAGTRIVHYWALNGELNSNGVQHPIGVVVHELGHSLFGLIDLYDTSGYNQALGNFSLMAAGSWGADIGEDHGTTPTNLDAWSRQYLGWTTPVQPSDGSLNIPSPLSSPTAAFKSIHPAVTADEYFLFENRQPVGWDRGLRIYFGPDWLGGLLVLHVDDSIASNRYVAGSHQKVVPIQANTTYCDMLMSWANCRGHATTLFFQGNNDTWNPDSAPDSDYYNGLKSGFSLSGISAPLSTMTATYDPDAIPPVVTGFTIPVTSTSLTVPITTLTATDNVGVTGYLVNESVTPPPATDPSWSAVKPGSYTFPSNGSKTLYAWARDEAGGVSASLSASVTVNSNDQLPAGGIGFHYFIDMAIRLIMNSQSNPALITLDGVK